jgi:hypothetical protein
MLRGSTVTTAWRVLTLRMEETASGLRTPASILNKQSRTDDMGSSSSFWELGVGLSTPRCKNKFVTKCHKVPRTWADSYGYEIRYMEYKKFVQGRLAHGSCGRNIKYKLDLLGVEEVRWDGVAPN